MFLLPGSVNKCNHHGQKLMHYFPQQIEKKKPLAFIRTAPWENNLQGEKLAVDFPTS